MLLKNERGSVLILALIVLVVGAMVGVALLTVGVNEDIQVSAAEKNLQAYYVARAAADAIAEFIVVDYEAAYDMGIFSATVGSPVITDPNVPIEFADGTATAEVYIINEGGEDRVVIEAFSEYGTDFIGHAILILDNKEYFEEYAVWSKNTMTNNDMEIGVEPDGTVKVGSNGSIPGDEDPSNKNKIDVYNDGSDPVDDTVIIKENVGEIFYDIEIPTGLTPYSEDNPNDLVISNNEEITIGSSVEIDTLNIKNGGTLIIDTGGEGSVIEIVLVEDSIVNSDVEITGSGAVKIYVAENKKLDIQTPLSASDDPEKMTIILGSGATLEFSANGDVYGYVYGPNATVDLGSSGTTLYGGIIAGDIDSNGNANIVYNKPSADYDTDFPPGVQRGEWRD